MRSTLAAWRKIPRPPANRGRNAPSSAKPPKEATPTGSKLQRMDFYEESATGASWAGRARRKVSKRQMAQRDAVELEGFSWPVKIVSQSKSLQSGPPGAFFRVFLALGVAAREVIRHPASKA